VHPLHPLTMPMSVTPTGNEGNVSEKETYMKSSDNLLFVLFIGWFIAVMPATSSMS